MAKKESSMKLSSIFLIGGVGLAGFALYQYLSRPAASAPGIPLQPNSGAQASRGPAYQKWSSLIQSYNGQYQTGVINGAVLNERLNAARAAVNRDFGNSLLSTRDRDELNSEINSYFV